MKTVNENRSEASNEMKKTKQKEETPKSGKSLPSVSIFVASISSLCLAFGVENFFCCHQLFSIGIIKHFISCIVNSI